MKVFKPEYVKGLRQLTDNPRNELVISITSVGHILSRYGDIIWDFSPYIHLKGSTQHEKKINFSTIRFDDGSCLTDPQHSPLLS